MAEASRPPRSLLVLAIASSLSIAGWLIWSAQRAADERRTVPAPLPPPATAAPATSPSPPSISPATPDQQTVQPLLPSPPPDRLFSTSKSALPVSPPQPAADDEEMLSTSKSGLPVRRKRVAPPVPLPLEPTAPPVRVPPQASPGGQPP